MPSTTSSNSFDNASTQPATDNLNRNVAPRTRECHSPRSHSFGWESEACFVLDKLSAELRNEIYELLVVSDHPIALPRLQYEEDVGKDTKETRSINPNFFRVCKQIRQGCKPMLYGSNTFTMIEGGYRNWPRFFETIGALDT
ncbi:uncharacterized protein RCC_04478 [Ramularia collo-cygni]|uniref:Uncharacterized protein n=1 Tax=Ramularia collo-cygni TaxID=112498 RepID=A0A2D3V7U2_9PEZI|nr:uncharacterized protein RCC_04478 [Ramularia collo-cygni]CZT18634.1 uncharacterized protein RCC_04478 [Ramularia collo-cygni]